MMNKNINLFVQIGDLFLSIGNITGSLFHVCNKIIVQYTSLPVYK